MVENRKSQTPECGFLSRAARSPDFGTRDDLFNPTSRNKSAGDATRRTFATFAEQMASP
jgi:hypothetical protein